MVTSFSITMTSQMDVQAACVRRAVVRFSSFPRADTGVWDRNITYG